MIALLAAVPEETHLIRQSLQDFAQRSVNGITLMTGKLSGIDVCLTHSGIGKAAAAATAISLLYNCRPKALWLFGCGGAYLNSGLTIGDLALADSEIFGDEGVATAKGFRDLAGMGIPMRQASEQFFNTWPVDKELHDWAQPLLQKYAQRTDTNLCSGPFVTVSTCTGTTTKATEIEDRTDGICENMEGAAVALACQQLSVPLLEVRGISNLVEDRGASRWDLPAGMAAAQNATLALLHEWPGQGL
ncbi:MAG: futalosine hydrolase [Deltaproteobacteria bacterium]|nr:MAG: futalosine hydrolase [Deltaproteobacteria bacterium]